MKAIPDGIRLLKPWRRWKVGHILPGWSPVAVTLCEQGIAERWIRRGDESLAKAVAVTPPRTATRGRKASVTNDD